MQATLKTPTLTWRRLRVEILGAQNRYALHAEESQSVLVMIMIVLMIMIR
jgi:hypothetical protein